MVTQKKRPGKKPPIKSQKPLTDEALYDKIAEEEFAAITMNASHLIKEDWLVVDQHERDMLRALVTAPAMDEPEHIKESAILTARTKLADVYHRAGLEGDLVDGFGRAKEFVTKALATIEKLKGTKHSIGPLMH